MVMIEKAAERGRRPAGYLTSGAKNYKEKRARRRFKMGRLEFILRLLH